MFSKKILIVLSLIVNMNGDNLYDPINERKNLRFDNENIYMNSEMYEENHYLLD
jgi:hypothetical protein